MTDLAKLVGENAEHLWDYLPYKKIYYRNDAPCGIIGTFFDNGTTVIFSMAENDRFTRGMIRDIVKMYRTMDIALVSDMESKFDYIKQLLEPHGFIFSIAETESGMKFMYAIHHKEYS